MKRKWSDPVLNVQVFTPKEYVAVCFDFCCDAETYTWENQNFGTTPYLYCGISYSPGAWIDGGDYYDYTRGSWHYGSQGSHAAQACHGTIANELWAQWKGQLSGTKDCRGLQVNYMALRISGTDYTDTDNFASIPSSALGVSHIVIYITNAYGSAPEYHKGHTTPITNAS